MGNKALEGDVVAEFGLSHQIDELPQKKQKLSSSAINEIKHIPSTVTSFTINDLVKPKLAFSSVSECEIIDAEPEHSYSMKENTKQTVDYSAQSVSTFSIALDESTAIFIRDVDEEVELLALRSLQEIATGKDIFFRGAKYFCSVKYFCSGVNCMDGAPLLIGSRKRFVGTLKERTTAMNVQECDLIILHCIIYQQDSKSIRLKNVMDVVVNFIRSLCLNHRQFKAFLDELSSEHDDDILLRSVDEVNQKLPAKEVPTVKHFSYDDDNKQSESEQERKQVPTTSTENFINEKDFDLLVNSDDNQKDLNYNNTESNGHNNVTSDNESSDNSK
ncbi:unnamed protein product [Psylliodes chrysocephalus]|uniref:Uncharacterized protein n=1 Tax=Psylliodes chrysocephalus TaxID=3402493 RepID=A0A9P0GE14_9CUCU|nr:unnamed protein product [Psylliodes chrysocephala]